MGMKKPIYYIIAFIIFCYLADIGINHTIAQQIDNRSPVYLSFASSGANLLEFRLDSWAKIKTANSFSELEKELNKIMQLLSLPQPQSELEYSQTKDQISVSYQVKQGPTQYYLKIQTENDATYYSLTAISAQDDKILRIDEAKLRQAYKCQSYFQYTGNINDFLDLDGCHKTMYTINKCLQAEATNLYEVDNMVSMAAFSPMLAGHSQIKLAGQTYNFQVAIRNDKANKQTYVYLGIPLLLNEY